MKTTRLMLLAFSLLGLLLLIPACKGPEPPTPDPVEETGIFEINFLPRVGGQSFQKDFVFKNILGQRFTVTDFRILIADLTLVREDGSDTLISENLLFNFAEEEVAGKTSHGEGIFRQFDIPEGNYKGIRFGLGVPEDQNQGDPTQYDRGHPLSTFSGTHWNWTTGYKFIQIDGFIDTTGTDTGPLNQGMAYHTGLNELYRELSYLDGEDAFEIKKDTELQFQFELDLNRFFYNQTDTIDMVARPFSHTTPINSEAYHLAEEITDNVVNNAIFKVPF